MNAANLRYIVFIIESKYKQHDGMVFTRYIDAKEYVADMLDEPYNDKAIIGTFYLDGSSSMSITHIETIGHKGDRNDVRQLDLFKSSL